jgi:hypothetical protein
MLKVIGDEIWFDDYRVGFVDRVGMLGPACPASIVNRFEQALADQDDVLQMRDSRSALSRADVNARLADAYRAGYRSGWDDAVDAVEIRAPDFAEPDDVGERIEDWLEDAA